MAKRMVSKVAVILLLGTMVLMTIGLTPKQKGDTIRAISDSESLTSEQKKDLTNAILTDESLTPEQKVKVINAVDEKCEKDKQKIDEQAKEEIGIIFKFLREIGTYFLVGVGIFAGMIVLIIAIVVPRIWPKKKED